MMIKRVVCSIFISATFNALAITSIIGHIDPPVGNYKSLLISGWACQTADPTSISVHLYAGGAAGTGVAVKSTAANLSSEAAVSSMCTTNYAAHRFSFSLSQKEIYQQRAKSIYVHGISTQGTPNLTIAQSGVYSVPNHPTSQVIGHIDNIVLEQGAFYLRGWACQTYYDSPIQLKIYLNATSLIATIKADQSAEAEVSSTCQSAGVKHRFKFKLEQAILDNYANAPISIEGISPLETGNLFINLSGSIAVPNPQESVIYYRYNGSGRLTSTESLQ